MIKAIIVEDDYEQGLTLKAMLCNLPVEVEALAICADIASAQAAIALHQPELVFLDIMLEGGETGFGLLKTYEKPGFSVIFTSHHNTADNTINAIRLCALDFLPKPISATELGSAIERYNENKKQALEQVGSLRANMGLAGNTGKAIWVQGNNEKIKLQLDDILYAYSENNYTYLVFRKLVDKKDKLLSSKNIGHWEGVLPVDGFFRIHNRYIVNLGYVAKYTNTTVKMADGPELELARQRKEGFLKALKSA
jgi:two-component system LytT family response regulator